MSVRSLAALAVERDRAAAGRPAGGGAGAAAVAPAGGAAGQRSPRGAVAQSFTDVVVSAIPTEPLAAYTALVGVVVGVVGADSARDYLPFRWWAYAAFLAVVVAAVWLAYTRALRGPLGLAKDEDVDDRRSVPVAEIGSALLAGGAWGLAMPGSPLAATLTGTVRTLTTASVLIGTAAVLSLLTAPQLKTGATSRKARRRRKAGSAPAAAGAAAAAEHDGSAAPILR
jgi:hypothetical protein